MNKRILKNVLLFFILTLSIILALGGVWALNLNSEIRARLHGRRFSPPVEFYSAPERLFKGEHLSGKYIQQSLERAGIREKKSLPIGAGQFVVLGNETCGTVIPIEVSSLSEYCVAFKRKRKLGSNESTELELIAVSADNSILEVFRGEPATPISVTELQPELFAQFVGNEPILRNEVELGEAPPACLNSVLAIEDADFLEHKGISVTGIARALIKNIFRGHAAQGGSTITQQLVKNYFLTPEKTLRRKAKEVVMAILLETQATKDEILETYINEIYMGQNGVFQVHGFGAASIYYFNKNLEDLDLPECSLLAAIVNSPGRFNPFVHPENALKRRNRVLDKMVELKIMSEDEVKLAREKPVPKPPKRLLSEPAPYFVDAVRTELKEKGLDSENGLRVYTTLNQRAQEAAIRAIQRGLENLESKNLTKNSKIAKNKAAGKRLEGVLVASDPLTGQIQALVGGRSFRLSQYNRVIQSRRQVGSVMKPLVYLTALESLTPEGQPYTPITLINDEKTKFRYENQTWEPENYEHEYYGQIPLFFALKNSLNAATAGLGVSIGLDSIVDLARRMGVTSKLRAMPALTLGAFEMSPFEVLQVYSTISRMGEFTPLTTLDSVEDLNGNKLLTLEPKHNRVVAAENAAVLVGMMKQTILSGTAKAIPRLGFTHPAAGKTGTTSDNKDSWFAGFTPFHVAVAWVGYDDATSHGLTGASGAVPIWTDYMQHYASQYPPQDFQWPDGTVSATLSPEAQEALGIPNLDGSTLTPVELIFRKGTEPNY